VQRRIGFVVAVCLLMVMVSEVASAQCLFGRLRGRAQADVGASSCGQQTQCTQAACAQPTYSQPVASSQCGCATQRDFATPVRSGLAQAKAEMQAGQGRMRHVGGGFGGGSAEGVGFSTRGPDEAIRNSCYWGQRTPIDIGVRQGANGWYATVIYQ